MAGVAAASFVAACGGASQPTATVPSRPTATATPTPTATPLPAGPYAVAVTNSGRTGTTYDVLIVASSGTVVAHTTARLPLFKVNQTVRPALVSVSNSLVYYRDGDTDIMSLSPRGASAFVTSIPGGSTSILGFAVNADGTKIAVSLMSQSARGDFVGSTSQGYVEDLSSAANHVDLWSNTDADALRFPVGWHGNDVIDQVGFRSCPYNAPGSSAVCGASATSYHVIDAATGSRSATVCEAPTSSPAGLFVYSYPDGLPVAAGVACWGVAYDSRGATPVNTLSVSAFGWSGASRAFVDRKYGPDDNAYFGLSGYFLSPDGARIACVDGRSGAINLLTPDGQAHSLGRVFTILGWIDTAHLLIDIDKDSLAVFDPDNGNVTSIPLAQADKVAMVATLPGSL